MKVLYLSLSMLFALLFVVSCSSKPSTQSPTPVPSASESPSAQSTALYVCVELANIRSGPGTSYPVLKQLTQGTSVTPVQKSGEWYYLGQDDAKNDTYIHETVVCAQPDATATSESSPITGSCPTGCTDEGSGCTIKGNISSKTSAKTYYMRGDPGYDLVIIDPDYGERWFCTEAEAKANGWHRIDH